jgi:hypothetical protein
MAEASDARVKKTRACALACEARGAGFRRNTHSYAREKAGRCDAIPTEPPPIVIRAVRVPTTERRVLLVLVDVERDGLRMTFSVARRRGGLLEVCSPRGPDGIGDGVWFPAAERQRVTSAVLDAVRGHTGARQTLRF